MDRNTMKCKNGMTILEVLTSCAIIIIVISAVLAGWYFTSKIWAEERIRSRLRINLEIAMERIKGEIRLSSTSLMSYYESGKIPYDAISFPKAVPDQNGFFTLDNDGFIVWDETVIYHVYDNPIDETTELRRTVFNPRDNALTATQRYEQLSKVVTNGDGSGPGTPNGQNAVTDIIFKNLVDLDITPKDAVIDLYNPTTVRKDVDFGSIRLTPGNHDFKFEVMDKNESSMSYGLGIDTISISPSGCEREGEFYIPPYASSGDSATASYALDYSGNYYLNYGSDVIGDYITLRLYYDLWREANFKDSIRDNTVLIANTLFIKLANPKEGKEISWTAEEEVGREGEDDPDQVTDINIRNIISADDLETGGKLCRVKFASHSQNEFTINSAYIEEVDSGSNGTGAQVQLYFNDPPVQEGEEEGGAAGLTIGETGNAYITIPADHYTYSNWMEYDIDPEKSYFVTFYVSLSNPGYDKYWTGTATHSYTYKADTPPTPDVAGTSIWSTLSPAPLEKNNIYAVVELEVWTDTGTATSRIYDTKLEDPGYNQISWTAYKPSGTGIIFKARSSDDENMTGATDWGSITGSSQNPHSLGIGQGRYAQFQAELSKASPYDQYDQYPTIDDVTIDWPGQTKICDISGYFVYKPNYGIIRLTVDGNQLIKALKFNIEVYEIFMDKTYAAELTAEIESRNTGR